MTGWGRDVHESDERESGHAGGLGADPRTLGAIDALSATIAPNLGVRRLERHQDVLVSGDPPRSSVVGSSSIAARTRPWRLLDVLLAGFGLALSAPLLGIVALAIRMTSRGPVVFRQERVGRHGVPFTVYKLRTMYVGGDDGAHREMCLRQLTDDPDGGAAADGIYKLDGDTRITPVGRWLRRFSIDELPQLANVLRGDMAVVGPRPMLPWEWDVLSDEHRRRGAVAPGLTGLWQVSGRNRLNMVQMLDLDVDYVDRRTRTLDVQIIARTVAVLIRGDGAR